MQGFVGLIVRGTNPRAFTDAPSTVTDFRYFQPCFAEYSVVHRVNVPLVRVLSSKAAPQSRETVLLHAAKAGQIETVRLHRDVFYWKWPGHCSLGQRIS